MGKLSRRLKKVGKQIFGKKDKAAPQPTQAPEPAVAEASPSVSSAPTLDLAGGGGFDLDDEQSGYDDALSDADDHLWGPMGDSSREDEDDYEEAFSPHYTSNAAQPADDDGPHYTTAFPSAQAPGGSSYASPAYANNGQPVTRVYSDDESSESSLSSLSSESSESASVFEDLAPTAQTDDAFMNSLLTALEARLANGVEAYNFVSDAVPKFNRKMGTTLLDNQVLDAARTQKRFWRGEGGKIESRHYALEGEAGRIVDLIVRGTDDRRDLSRSYQPPNQVPFKANTVVKYAEDAGYFVDRQGVLQVEAAGLGVLARSAAARTGEQGRLAADQSQGGWATLGMTANHVPFDQNHKVTYHRTEQDRSDTALKLSGGVFRWDKKDKKASAPNLKKHKVDTEEGRDALFALNPNFIAQRGREIMTQNPGMSAQEGDLEAYKELQSNPRLIFVMDSAGDFYASQGRLHEIHHSTFLAGKAVAAAGEVALNGGRCTYVSDASGHYLPGPAYMWQALHAMGAKGVKMKGVDVKMFGVTSEVKADWFLRNFVPGVTVGPLALPMTAPEAKDKINDAIAEGRDRGGQAPAARSSMTISEQPKQISDDSQFDLDESSESSSSSLSDSSETSVFDQPFVPSGTTYTLQSRQAELEQARAAEGQGAQGQSPGSNASGSNYTPMWSSGSAQDDELESSSSSEESSELEWDGGW